MSHNFRFRSLGSSGTETSGEASILNAHPLIEERLSGLSIDSFFVGPESAGFSCEEPPPSGSKLGWHRSILERKRGDRWFFTSLFLMLLIRAPVVRVHSWKMSSGAESGMLKARTEKRSVPSAYAEKHFCAGTLGNCLLLGSGLRPRQGDNGVRYSMRIPMGCFDPVLEMSVELSV
jgi:hypothetical protein